MQVVGPDDLESIKCLIRITVNTCIALLMNFNESDALNSAYAKMHMHCI